MTQVQYSQLKPEYKVKACSQFFIVTVLMMLKYIFLYSELNLLLKSHRQISKKRCFEKYCSCDKVCQFSALWGTP